MERNKKVNSKKKGNSGEREVVKLLQNWWGKAKIEFKRTPNSGAWDNSGKWKMKGDIICNDITFKYSVEVKRPKNFNIYNVIMSDKYIFWSWWSQTLQQAIKNKMYPLLAIRANGQQWLFITEKVCLKPECNYYYFKNFLNPIQDFYLINNLEYLKKEY